MTNTQLFLAVGLPILIVVLGFIWNGKSSRAETAVLRGEMNVLRAEMNGKFDVISTQLATITRTQELMQQDLKRFYEITTALDKRVLTLENKQ